MLKEILDAKKRRLAVAKEQTPLEILKDRISLAPKSRNFRQALLGQNLSIIAEIKKASPSLGDIVPDLDIQKTAIDYEKGGVSAISVLTEEDYFKGASEHIKIVKENVRIPVLRKDFLFEEYQIYESRYLGADALLLIAAILDESLLSSLVDLSLSIDIEPLVEVHSEEDLRKALKTEAKVFGINNRDLSTFKTDISTTERLISLIGNGKIIISESGIKSAQDVKMLKQLGVDAILVGESIVKSGDFKKKIEQLMVDS